MPLTSYDGLPRASASSLGIDPDRLIAFLDEVKAADLDLHGFMLHRHGHVVAEGWTWPVDPNEPRVLHSMAKSFTGCAIGLAIQEGLLNLDDRLVRFFPDEVPANADPRLADMTVEHLLTMRTGHASNTSGSVWRSISTSWIAEFFKIPLAYAPGSEYVYTSAASYMLSALINRVTGQTLHDYLKPRLFIPLDIYNETWDIGPDGVNPGGNGLTAPVSAALKLAVLHAQNGVWDGRQVLPAAWVQAATQPQGGPDSRYGYHWMMKPRPAFSALGVFVQMAAVYREHNATLVLVGGMKNSAEIVPFIERYFPAAFSEDCSVKPEADSRLEQRLASMAEQPLLVSDCPAPEDSIRVFVVAENGLGVRQLSFAFTGHVLTFELTDSQATHRLQIGIDHWLTGLTSMPGRALHHGYEFNHAQIVAGARWLDQKTLEMTWIYPQTAFRDRVKCVFEGNTVSLARTVNVNSAEREQEVLVGKRL
ncbi:serine hydrolase [Pseudomonas aylmerensis]|uniref:Serine hydrolase n=1 Tax=Pseudomonas aylmerensis TaxID=1869229 RepID=A0A2T4FNX3_9PSED|nr:serine hydrolase [Pseudomonas aylmerensis]OCW24211.1 serine hydrolase [Pseudomonas aylmerensis]PTC25113.1 serine hydrolase [Pseudomonas aylmerensis]